MTNDTSNPAAESPSTPLQTPVDPKSNQPDPAIELTALRERLAALESDKAQADKRAVEIERATKIGTAKSRAIVNHLAGDFDLEGYLPNTDDPAALEAAAVKLRKKLQTIKPDFGGASKDGGLTPSDPRQKSLYSSTAGQLIEAGFSCRLPALGAKAPQGGFSRPSRAISSGPSSGTTSAAVS